MQSAIILDAIYIYRPRESSWMDKTQSLGKGTAYNFAARAILVLTGYATAIVLGRSLGPETYGIYGIVTSLVFVATIVLMTSIEQTTSKFVSEKPRHGAEITYKIMRLQLFVSLFFTAAYFFLAPVLAAIFNDITLIPYIKYTSLLIVFQSLFSVFVGWLNGQRKFKQQALLNMFYSSLKAVLVIGFVMLGYSIAGALTGFIIAAIVSVLACMTTLRPARGKYNLPTNQATMYFIPVFLFSMITLLLMHLDLFFVKAFNSGNLGNLLSGYYAAAITLSRIPYYAMTALATTIFPLISEMTYHQKAASARKLIDKSMKFIMIALIFISLIVAKTAKPLVSISYGSMYEPAGQALAILIFGSSLFALFLFASTIILASGKPKHAFIIGTICLVIDFILNYQLVPRYGMIGAAAATTITMLLAALISVYYICSKFNTTISAGKLILTVIAGLSAILVSSLVPSSGLMLLLNYAVSGSFYTAMLFLLRVLRTEDILLLRKIFLKS